MLNYLLTILRKYVTIHPVKRETIPQIETQEKEIETMTQNDMIVNTFRDYLRFLAADCSVATKNEITENFKRARNVRMLARESGVLANLDRAIKHDSVTNRVFVKSDFKSGAYINA
jgi:hypothetical protein